MTNFPVTWPSNPGTEKADAADQYWHALLYFNIYRLIIGSSLLIISWKPGFSNFGSYDYTLFLYSGLGHLLCSTLSILLIRLHSLSFNWQLAIQITADIIFFTIMLYASGGLQSGLGVLLLISIAAAGLISYGRLALFFASVATIGLLLQETYSLLTVDSYTAQYTQAGLLSIACFAVAWLAHQLAKRTMVSEQLAQERSIDLANMAQVNQLIIQELQEGVLVLDKDGNIRQRNSYADKLLNLYPSKNRAELLRLSDYAPEITDRLSSWQDNSAGNFDLLRLTQSNALVRTRFLPIQAKDSRSGIVIFLEDMGRVQAQLQQIKLAALGRLTANIAHEIRNPLSAINHAAELLEEEQIASHTNTRLVQIISTHTQRLNKIVQDVLQLNRRNIPTPEVINPHEFIHVFLDEFCHTEGIDRDTFLLSDSRSLLIHFDRDHLNQILWNLCRNAWRHCSQQSGSIRIVFSAEAGENHVLIDIIDDGPGIDPEQARHLFEPFFTTASEGTGLGLYIAQEICENNHALLECVDSSHGAHFRIICKGNASC